jgi:hypothetical protein
VTIVKARVIPARSKSNSDRIEFGAIDSVHRLNADG